jgi:hypothetical protein
MRSLCFSLLLTAVALLGADFTGSWKGSLKMKSPDGQVIREGDAHMTLKQAGSTVTGEAGTDGDSYPIQNGKAEGGVLTFTVQPPDSDAIQVKVSLNEAGELVGQANAEIEGRKVMIELRLKK